MSLSEEYQEERDDLSYNLENHVRALMFSLKENKGTVAHRVCFAAVTESLKALDTLDNGHFERLSDSPDIGENAFNELMAELKKG